MFVDQLGSAPLLTGNRHWNYYYQNEHRFDQFIIFPKDISCLKCHSFNTHQPFLSFSILNFQLFITMYDIAISEKTFDIYIIRRPLMTFISTTLMFAFFHFSTLSICHLGNIGIHGDWSMEHETAISNGIFIQ